MDIYNSEYFDALFEVNNKHCWFVARREMIYELLVERFRGGNLSDISMLEVGCGNGGMVDFLSRKGIKVEGSDFHGRAQVLLTACQHATIPS